MTESLAALLAAHAGGKALRATIDETYDRVERHNDPALFIALRPRAEALAIAGPPGGRTGRRPRSPCTPPTPPNAASPPETARWHAARPDS